MEIVSIILAGGCSSRMGTDKALLQIDGLPLLERTARIAGTISSPVYIITPRTEKYRSIVSQECIFIQETILEGGNRSNSPLIGFSQALNYLESTKTAADWILLLACDLPRLNALELLRWRQLLLGVKDGTMAFLPKSPVEKQPKSSAKKRDYIWEALCGFYRPNCRKSLKEYINKGGRSFQGWSNDIVVEELVVEDDRVLFNCNTPEDLTECTL